MGYFDSPSSNKSIHKALRCDELDESKINSDLVHCFLPILDDKDIELLNTHKRVKLTKKIIRPSFFPTTIRNSIKLPANENVTPSNMVVKSKVLTPITSKPYHFRGVYDSSDSERPSKHNKLYGKNDYFTFFPDEVLIPDLSEVKSNVITLRKKRMNLCADLFC